MAGQMISQTFPATARNQAQAWIFILVSVAVLSAALTFGLSSKTFAQDVQVQGLVDRVDRLQRELQTLQRQVYRGEAPPAEIAPAVTTGALAGGAAGGAVGLDSSVAVRIELRLSQLEAQLRELTGKIEESEHRQRQLRGLIDKLAADTDLRLQQLEQGGMAATGQGAVPGQPSAQQSTMAADSSLTGGRAPSTLGTVRAADVEALQTGKVEAASPVAADPNQTQQAYVLPGNTTQEQYQSAFGLLSQANYGEAELALRAFVEQNPEDPLAGNAKYWLGETYYVRQDYQQAAITFAEGYQQYPDNPKAPDNLLKLGMSLSSLGSNADACGTFAELLKRYPNAASTIQQRAKQERQRLACG